MLTRSAWCARRRLGSIANFYAAPVTKVEFLLGKQLPYIAVALIQFVLLVSLAVFLFGVPIKGSSRRSCSAACSTCWRAPASAC